MKKIDMAAVVRRAGSRYPKPFDEPCLARVKYLLGDAAGLTQFGVNTVELQPGAWSAQRHWHSAEDEFVMVLEGELVLVTDDGEELMRPGDCAGFKAGDPNGHKLENRTEDPARYLEVGTRSPTTDAVDYPDINMVIPEGTRKYVRRDGTPY